MLYLWPLCAKKQRKPKEVVVAGKGHLEIVAEEVVASDDNFNTAIEGANSSLDRIDTMLGVESAPPAKPSPVKKRRVGIISEQVSILRKKRAEREAR